MVRRRAAPVTGTVIDVDELPTGAEPARRDHQGETDETATGLAEELAGRGYVVAAIGHNHEANGITFPDGHTTGCVVCGNPDYAEVGAVRAADVSFVLDELTGNPAVWQYGSLIDPDRVAMVGHSAGGFSTVPALLPDARVKAAADMDGNFRYPTANPWTGRC